jgi:energy-coupling factor transporter ATP-binding protein EcfA2
LYRHLRVVDQLAAARALNDPWDADLAGQRLSALGMATSARVGKLSAGQQAQLALTMALARRPRLLLLDEPLASLDPLARQDVLGWLMTCVAEDGLSVVFSSHVIAELERVASYLVVLSAGRIQVAATVDSLLDTHLALTGPADGVDDLYDQVEIVTAQPARHRPAGRAARSPWRNLSLVTCGNRPPASYLNPVWRLCDDRYARAADDTGRLVQAPVLGGRHTRRIPAGRAGAIRRRCRAAALAQRASPERLPGGKRYDRR